jgi:hypothetical protein
MNEATNGAERARKLAIDYLTQSGMSPEDFARRIGYNPNTFAQFRNGHYAKITSPSRICAAILNFIDRFPLQADIFTGKLYETEAVKLMRGVFTRLLAKPQMILTYAPSGSGKTDIPLFLIAEHNSQRPPEEKTFIFRVNCRESICPRDLMKRVAAACGTESHTAIDRVIHNLRWDFRGARVVLYFDEAPFLSIRCLQTVRELMDEEPKFSLCFSGYEGFDPTFADFSSRLEPLQRRIIDRVKLPSLTNDEAVGILKSELAGQSLDAEFIRQQIKLATVNYGTKREAQNYISIGRLMAAIGEIRKSLAIPAGDAQKEEAVA